MIRFLEYVGNKEQKAVHVGLGKSVVFPKGKVVDVIEAGMAEKRAKELLKTGLFRLHGSSDPVPFDIPERAENQCACGFQAKTKAGLKAHERSCAKA